jgi:excinuclease ABC subunit A
MPAETIKISGARQHNLKNLHVEIPREKLVVITGLSGSGKSSLAFDTLYAEGQRRYVESLSAYARQFLDKMEKPEVDFIEGLSPAIAIEQRSAGANPRSTIATTTEIYDYLRVLFSAVGQPHDPVSGRPIHRQTPQQIVDQILAYEPETKITLLAPLVQNQTGEFRDVIEKLKREGFVRVRIDGEILELGRSEPIRLKKSGRHNIEAVVDRLVVRDGIRSRLADSVETALKWGEHRLVVLRTKTETFNVQRSTFNVQEKEEWEELRYSTDYSDPETGFSLGELTPKHFSFNSHLGACPACHGLGTQLVCDVDLMISDPQKTLAEGAITPWRRGTKPMRAYYRQLQSALVKHFGVDEEMPFAELPNEFTKALYFGTGDEPIEMNFGSNGKHKVTKPFEGLVPQMERLYEETESEFTRNRIRGFMTRVPCKVCGGARLKPEILAVTICSRFPVGSAGETLQNETVTPPTGRRLQELNIHQFSELTTQAAAGYIANIQLTKQQRTIVSDVLHEIESRLQFLAEVGLGYLTLNRESGTLSGGEAQRIRLATQIGSGLAGVLYVLDEPSIGLHQRDNARLLTTLRRLRDLGNSVIVVEHDEETIRAADHILDLGPGAGPRGGELVAQGRLEEILEAKNSLTADYLSGRARIAIPRQRVKPRPDDDGWLTLIGAAENNLKNIDVSFPLGLLTCVTGVSGSGKSTLVDDILRRALFRHFYNSKDKPGTFRALRGLEHLDKAIVIDQSAIGRTPRSNPITYTGAFTPIRELFAQLPNARVRGYDAGRFSFNVKGGRCENCEGAGLIKIEMHFLPDVYVECEVCRGHRYNRETLEITFKGKNIADVLEMTVDEAARFFRNVPSVSDKLVALLDVGLGYLRLGQAGTTLSGGEAQRVKLATELAKRATGRTIYILDEPTTGLHFADIEKLLQVLMKLRDAGNTLVVIEHNLEMIKCADWIIDLGPGGGEGGGEIVGEGPPEKLAKMADGFTGQYLRPLLNSR